MMDKKKDDVRQEESESLVNVRWVPDEEVDPEGFDESLELDF